MMMRQEPTICDLIALDVIAESLQLVDSRDLVRFAAAASANVLHTLRASGWSYHPSRCLTPAARAELAELGVHVRLDSRKLDNNGDCSEQWVAPDGRHHREDDLPAVIAVTHTAWYFHGILHRENNQPAIVRHRTGKWWYHHGRMHRDDNDLPAVEWSSGMREWFINGKRLRKNGKHVIEHPNGDREWRDDGSFSSDANRENDLPSIERANGDLEWRRRGFLSRDNGLPNIIRANGTREWWRFDELEKTAPPEVNEEEEGA